ncbi:MAG: ATP-binding cassette domain-containing protein, partial [Dongiales bacterium]
MALVEIRNLNVTFKTARGLLHAVENLDLTLEEGELLGIVGESGSGKSVTMLALMGLIPWPGKVTADRLTFDGKNILTLSAAQRRRIIGKDIAMIFQEPMTSLNPLLTVGFQIEEVLNAHLGLTGSKARLRGVKLLEEVGIPNAASRYDDHP